jgi:hypothetical protein
MHGESDHRGQKDREDDDNEVHVTSFDSEQTTVTASD